MHGEKSREEEAIEGKLVQIKRGSVGICWRGTEEERKQEKNRRN